MNDVDQDVRRTLHRLIDPEPVDTERALRTVVTTRPPRRGPRTPVVIAAALVAVLAVAVFVPRGHPQSQRQLPPYKLVGAAGAEVVVRIDGSGAEPTAELTVGNTTVSGAELHGTPTNGGISFDESELWPAQPPVDVPDGSSLRVEGTFDSASASSVTSVTLTNDGNQGLRVLHVTLWQLDSSGGSVVFKGQGDRLYLVVRATIGSDQHYFLFPTHVVAAGG